MSETRRRVLSLIRATGRMHLGNWAGAIRQFVELGNNPDRDCMYGIASLHSLTTVTPDSLDDLRISRDGIVLDFLASGIDPSRTIVFDQSAIPETAMLTWLLSCLTSTPDLLRMGHLAEKTAKLRGGEGADKIDGDAVGMLQGVNAGLVTYPVLMAADILGPLGEIIPVGEDQHQHVEFARDLARRFNARFGYLFPIPELLHGHAVRVPSLRGTGKMGKSEAETGTIFLDDPPDTIWKKLRPAVTDPARARRTDPGNPENCPVGQIHGTLQMLGEEDQETWQRVQVGCTTASIGCIDCKRMLQKELVTILEPIQARRRKLEANGPDYVENMLQDGNRRMQERVVPVVHSAMKKMGVSPYSND